MDDKSFVQMSPVLWAMPGDEWEGGHVRIEGEHVATLNYQTQARAPAFVSFHQLSERIVFGENDLFWIVSHDIGA